MQDQEDDTEYGLDADDEEDTEYGGDEDITENPIDADTESRLLYGDTHADTKPVAYRFTLLMFGGAGAVLLLLSLMVVPWRRQIELAPITLSSCFACLLSTIAPIGVSDTIGAAAHPEYLLPAAWTVQAMGCGLFGTLAWSYRDPHLSSSWKPSGQCSSNTGLLLALALLPGLASGTIALRLSGGAALELAAAWASVAIALLGVVSTTGAFNRKIYVEIPNGLSREDRPSQWMLLGLAVASTTGGMLSATKGSGMELALFTILLHFPRMDPRNAVVLCGLAAGLVALHLWVLCAAMESCTVQPDASLAVLWACLVGAAAGPALSSVVLGRRKVMLLCLGLLTLVFCRRLAIEDLVPTPSVKI